MHASRHRDLVQLEKAVRNFSDKDILLSSLESGDFQTALQLLPKGSPSPPTIGPDNLTPLHYACQHGRADIALLLITEYNYSINSCSRTGQTPMHFAAKHGQIGVIKLLVKQICGTEPSGCSSSSATHISSQVSGTPKQQPQLETSVLAAADNDGNTPLHLAATHGHLCLINYLIHVARCNSVPTNNEKQIPLHLAAIHGHLKVVQYLVEEEGCDPSARDEQGRTPLYLAAGSGHLEVVKYLTTEKQCDPNCRTTKCKRGTEKSREKICHKFATGQTPLHAASQGGHLRVAQYLINELKCNSLCADDDGCTPLYVASLNGQTVIVTFLTKKKCVDPSWFRSIPLHVAAFKGSLEVVKFFINEKGCDPMCRGQWGRTPLHHASYKGHLEIVKYLIDEQHVDPSCLDEDEVSPLRLASMNGHLAVVKFLTENKHCDPLHKDKLGNTPLHGAASGGSLEVVTFFINEKGCDPMCRGQWGRTPLHHASDKGHLEIVKYLIDEQHVDPSCLDEDEVSPLRLASMNGHLAVVKFLTENKHCDPLHKDKLGNTALHGAASGGSLEVVKFFISEKGCDPMCRGQWGRTPLHHASDKGHLEIVNYLIDVQHIDPSCLDENEVSPLRLASMNGHLAVVKFLTENKHCDPLHKDKLGNTPLHGAAGGGNLEVVKFFINEKGCDPICRGQWGRTPLHYASERGHLEIVKYLIDEQHIDPSCLDEDEVSPLRLASLNGHLAVVMFLTENKHCDPLHKDKLGNTPLHGAAGGGNLEVVKFFINEKGCDPICRGQWGATPLHLAAKNGHLEVVRFLVGSKHCNPAIKFMLTATPFYLAYLNGHVHVALYLISKGAGTSFIDIVPMAQISTMTWKPLAPVVKVYVVGNSAAGKSTLIKALQDEAVSSAIIGRFINVYASSVSPDTVGIIPTEFNSTYFGEVTIYDFAGHEEYHFGHQAIFENMTNAVVLVLVDLTIPPVEIMKAVGYWNLLITRGAFVTGCHISLVVIGSHTDLLTTEEYRTKTAVLSAAITNFSHFENAGWVALDCRKTVSPGMSKLRQLLQQECENIRLKTEFDYLNGRILNAFIIKCLPSVAACTFKRFLSHVCCNSHPDLDPLKNPTVLYQVCESLNKSGHLILLKNTENPEKSWIILNKDAVLSKIHGLLGHIQICNKSGIVPLSLLNDAIRESEMKIHAGMITRYMLKMQFCMEIEPHSLKLIGADSNLSQIEEKCFFFPSIIRGTRPHDVWKSTETYSYSFGWRLKCTDSIHFFTPQFLQVLLIHLASRFALNPHPESPGLLEPAQGCRLWKNGIRWLDPAGIEVIAEIIDQNTTLNVILRCLKTIDKKWQRSNEMRLIQLRTSIIQRILNAKVHGCPVIKPKECLLHPRCLQTYPLEEVNEIPFDEVAEAIVNMNHYLRTDNSNLPDFLPVKDLLHFEPYHVLNLELLQRLFDEQYADETIPQDALSVIAVALQSKWKILSEHLHVSSGEIAKTEMNGRMSDSEKCLHTLNIWSEHDGTYGTLRRILDKYSIFAGRNPLDSCTGKREPQATCHRKDNGVTTTISKTKSGIQTAKPETALDSALSPPVPTSSVINRLGERPKISELRMVKTHSGEKVQIIKTITPKWRVLGHRLNFDPDGLTLDLIEAEKKLWGPEACCEEMFQLWLRGEGRQPATWRVLIELLEDAEYNHLAKQVKDMLGPTPPIHDKLGERPTMSELCLTKASSSKKVQIIKTLTLKWREFGHLLKFDPDGSTLDVIEAAKRDPEACCEEMFQRWLKGEGQQPATWRVLIELLEDAEYTYLLKQVKETLQVH